MFKFFGGFAFNLAAITAAICMEKDADPNRDTRYLAAVSAGVFYLIAALFGATVVALFSMSPKALILPLAGLALIGTLGNSLAIALDKPSHREAALVTFLVTVSGVVFWNWCCFLGIDRGVAGAETSEERSANTNLKKSVKVGGDFVIN